MKATSILLLLSTTAAAAGCGSHPLDDGALIPLEDSSEGMSGNLRFSLRGARPTHNPSI